MNSLYKIIDSIKSAVLELGITPFLLVCSLFFIAFSGYKTLLNLFESLQRRNLKIEDGYEQRIKSLEKEKKELIKKLTDCTQNCLDLQKEKSEAEGRAKALGRAIDRMSPFNR